MDSDPENESSFRFLCLCSAEGKVAAAYYELQSRRVSIMSQVPDPGPEFHVTKRVLQKVEPIVTIIPASSSAEFVKEVRSITDQEEVISRTPKHISDHIADQREEDPDEMDTDTDHPISGTSDSVYQTPASQIQSPGSESCAGNQTPRKRQKRAQTLLNRVSENVVTLASKFFAVENAKNFLLTYDGFGMEADASRPARQTYLAGVVDLEQTVTVRALAGLLTYMSRSAINQMPQLTGKLTFSSFRLPTDVMISAAALRSLAVTSEVLVPRPDRMAPIRRQELSLVKLFEAHCRTPLAKKMVRQMLMQPIRDPDELNERLNFVDHFLRPENACLLEPGSELRGRLFRIKSLNSVFRQMMCKLVPLSDWRTFINSFASLIQSMQTMIQLKKPDSMSRRAAELLTPDIMSLSQMIDTTVSLQPDPYADFYPENDSFHIKEKLCPELDERREMASHMSDYLTDATRRESQEWMNRNLPVPTFSIMFTYGPGFLMELSLHTAGLHHVVSVLEQRGADQVFYVTMYTGASVIYFKTQYLKHLDLTVGDRIQEIASLIVQIQQDVQEKVLEHADTIVQMVEHCASLESLLAFADMAKRPGWCRPSFTEERLHIESGKHPLYEELLQKEGKGEFHVNDTLSPSNGRKVHIITGPNASGKTVFLKQTGLITHLALCGSYVPAQSAAIPIVDSIFTMLKHNYSITMESSTFFSELKSLCAIMNQATGRSLILIDEFGKGTRPQDGIALLAAAVRYFTGKKDECPFLLLATHMHCLSQVLRPDVRSIQYLRFRPDLDEAGIFQPNFAIEEGKCESSLASAVYKKVELEDSVTERANQIFQTLCDRTELSGQYNQKQKEIIAFTDQILGIFQRSSLSNQFEIRQALDMIRDIPLPE